MRTLVALLGLLLVTGAAAGSSSAESELRAFERPKRESDVLRARVAAHLRVTDSRRIAVHEDRRGRRATLFVAKTRTDLCVMLVSSTAGEGVGGAGGGCSPAGSFFQGRHVAATSGRLFAGLVSNQVARVVLVGSRGVRHPIRPTSDGGFIYDCRAYNGCARLIACVEAYARDGRLLSKQAWLPRGCGPARRAASAPPGCTAVEAQATIRAFVADYNAGRATRAAGRFANEPAFEWFSTVGPGARLDVAARDRASLARYFRTRVRLAEQIRIVDSRAGHDAGRGLLHVSGRLVRSADDLRPTLRNFKGAVRCGRRPLLIVWSM